VKLYHGTIKAYADSIQKEGLSPHPENAFHVNSIPPSRGIYLTSKRSWAEMFANWRSEYSKAEPGDLVDFQIHKREDAQPPLNADTTPALVEFEIPYGTLPLKPDPDMASFVQEEALVCDCTVPPQYVKKVEEI
jgi:hypothetical protein